MYRNLTVLLGQLIEQLILAATADDVQLLNFAIQGVFQFFNGAAIGRR
jgi:hypothetical protein